MACKSISTKATARRQQSVRDLFLHTWQGAKQLAPIVSFKNGNRIFQHNDYRKYIHCGSQTT